MSEKIKIQDGAISYSAADPTELLDFTVEGSITVTEELSIGGIASTNVGSISTGDGTISTPARLDITTGEYGTVNIFQNTVSSKILLNQVQWPTGAVSPVAGMFLGVSSSNVLEYKPFIFATAGNDSLTTTLLNSTYTTIVPGQVVLGPTVIYYYTGSGVWRLISAPVVAP